MSRRPTQRVRLCLAVAIVAAIVFAAPAIDALAFRGDATSVVPDGQTGIRGKSVLDAPSFEGALEELESRAFQVEAAVPDWFEEEVGFLPGARDVRVDGSGRVVGYVVDRDAEAALDGLKQHMQSLGWTAVPLGQVEGFTFLKPHGSHTWLLATCTQAGAATCVVIRSAR